MAALVRPLIPSNCPYAIGAGAPVHVNEGIQSQNGVGNGSGNGSVSEGGIKAMKRKFDEVSQDVAESIERGLEAIVPDV